MNPLMPRGYHNPWPYNLPEYEAEDEDEDEDGVVEYVEGEDDDEDWETEDSGYGPERSNPFGLTGDEYEDQVILCKSQGVSPPKLRTIQSMQREAAERSDRILSNYSHLQKILQRHETTIQRRWESKSKKQRISLLLELWPDMPRAHRPDFTVVRKFSRLPGRDSRKNRDILLWPNINQEDLGEARSLLLLLNARGRNHPSKFASADAAVTDLGIGTFFFNPDMPSYTKKDDVAYILLVNGINDPENGIKNSKHGIDDPKLYGKLVGCSNFKKSDHWIETSKQMLPGEGLLMLELQDRLMQFLVQCCQKILHEIKPEDMIGDAYPILPEPSLKSSTVDANGLSSLTAMAKEAPYRVPEKLDLGRIESLLNARCGQAEDRIWALREDPGYFLHELLERKEHRQEMIICDNGKPHPALLPPREHLLWARCLGNILTESFYQLEAYTELRAQVRKLHTLHQKYEPELDPLEDLPEELLMAMLKFRHYLNETIKGSLNQLQSSVMASPPLRSMFNQIPPTGGDRDLPRFGVRMKSDSVSKLKSMPVTEQLLYLLRVLWEDGSELKRFGLSVITDELDRLLRSEPKALELTSSLIASVIGELSIAGECLRQIDLFQPWASGFAFALASGDREITIQTEYCEQCVLWSRMLNFCHADRVDNLFPWYDPTDQKFNYPVGKRQTQANIEAMRSAEAALDAFWAAYDKQINETAGDLTPTAYYRVLQQKRKLQRTPEWVEPAVKSKKERRAEKLAEEAAAAANFPSPILTPEPVTSGRKQILAVLYNNSKPKVKTHGLATGAIQETDQRQEPTPPDSPTAKSPSLRDPIQIDARALKVFRILFFEPTANTTAGEIAWRDFLHAMASTGFAAQKLYGSVWHFQPVSQEMERSIQFHEPHPSGKVGFMTARWWGRRLNRAYGWEGSLFVLKEKEAVKEQGSVTEKEKEKENVVCE